VVYNGLEEEPAARQLTLKPTPGAPAAAETPAALPADVAATQEELNCEATMAASAVDVAPAAAYAVGASPVRGCAAPGDVAANERPVTRDWMILGVSVTGFAADELEAEIIAA